MVKPFSDPKETVKWKKEFTWGTTKKDSFGRCTREISLFNSDLTVLETSCFRTDFSGAPCTTSLIDAIFPRSSCRCSIKDNSKKKHRIVTIWCQKRRMRIYAMDALLHISIPRQESCLHIEWCILQDNSWLHKQGMSLKSKNNQKPSLSTERKAMSSPQKCDLANVCNH